MSTRTLAVHLSNERLCLASGKSTLRSVQVDAILDLDRDHAMSLGRLLPGASWDRVVASFPATAGAYRFLSFVFRDRRRLAQAIGPALEEHIPLDLEQCRAGWDFVGSDRRGKILGLLVPRSTIAEQKEALAQFGAQPQRLVWAPCAIVEFYRQVLGTSTDYSVIDLSRDGATVATVTAGDLAGLRNIGSAPDEVLVRNVAWSLRGMAPPSSRVVVGGGRVAELAPALADALTEFRLEAVPDACPVTLSATTSTHWTAAAPALGLLLADHGRHGAPLLDFPVDAEKEDLGTGTAWQELRPLAPWAALVVILTASALVTDYSRLAARKHALEQRAETIFHRAMPGTPGGNGRKLKLEMRLKELQSQSRQTSGAASVASPLKVLASMSRTIPADLDVEFDAYSYDPPNIRLSGHGSSFETVTRVQKLLQARAEVATVEVQDVHAAVNGDGVDFQIHIGLARSGDSA